MTFIDPFLDEQTRTIKVRVNLKNPDRKLKAGMYASATIRVRLLGNGAAAPTGLEGKFSCPMHPEVIQDESGKCPVCKMDLIFLPEGSAFADFRGHAHAAHVSAVPRRCRSSGARRRADDQTITEAAMKETTADVTSAETPVNRRHSTSAVLDTGRRQITYRATKDGNYEFVELQVGLLATSTDKAGRVTYYPVLNGLNEGDSVVIRGGFLSNTGSVPSAWWVHVRKPTRDSQPNLLR